MFNKSANRTNKEIFTRTKILLKKSTRLLLISILLFNNLFFPNLKAKAETVNPANTDLELIIQNQEDDITNGKSTVKFQLKSDYLDQNHLDPEYTVFVFYGDNFYKSYKQFTAKYSEFPEIIHEYKGAGNYKPLLVAYSNGFQYRQFKFFETIKISYEEANINLRAKISSREDDPYNGKSTVNFSFEQNSTGTNDPNREYTFFLFFGDNFYREYKRFSGKFSEIPLINHQYTKPGVYRPLLIAYSNGFKYKTFKFLDPIEVTQNSACKDPAWYPNGNCKADCGSKPGLQEEINACGEIRLVSCNSQACSAEPFKILNEYLEAPGYLSLEADISKLINPEELSYRFIINPNSNNKKEQIFQKSTFQIESPGTYETILEIYRNSFLISKYTNSIVMKELNKPPIAQGTIDKSSGEAPLVLAFDASTSTDPENSNLEYHWDFGDDTTVNDKIVSHNYLQPGKYKPKLKVTDNRGLYSEKVFNEILVEEKNIAPTAKFLTEVKDCSLSQNNNLYLVKLEHQGNKEFYCNINFDGLLSFDPNKNLNKHNWSIKDLNQIPIFTNEEPKFIFKFNKPDEYTIDLKVTDSKNASGNTSTKIKILEPLPVIVANISSRQDNLNAGTSNIGFSAAESFAYSSTTQVLNSDSNLLKFTWDFGDGYSDLGREVTHNYSKPGSYSPRIKLCKYCNDSDTSNDLIAELALETIVIDIKKPTLGSVSFSSLLNVEGSSSSIENITIGNIVNDTWKWIFRAYLKNAAGETVLVDKSNELNTKLQEKKINILDAPVVFDEAGQYELIHDLNGKQILSETLTVQPNQIPIPKITLSHSIGSYNASVSAEGSYDPKDYNIVSYFWDFGDGKTATGITASNTYTNKGIYYIKLTVTDSKGLISNAYSSAVIVGNIDIPSNAPNYNPQPDIESSNDNPNGTLTALLFSDKQVEFNTLQEILNENSNAQESTLTLPTDLSCKQSSCACTVSFSQSIKVNSINFIEPSSTYYFDGGARKIEILGTNFCTHNHEVKVKVDNGEFETRSSSFINSGKIVAILKPKDFKGSTLTIRVRQNSANGNNYYSEKTITIPIKSVANLNLNVLNGNSNRIELNSSNNFFIQSNSGQGDANHYWNSSKGPIFFNQDGTLYSKNIFISTVSGTRAKLAIDFNGNRFEGLKVKVNGSLVLEKNPGTGKKFSRVVTDAFTINSGELKIEILFTAPHETGVNLKAITIVSSPSAPAINTPDVFFIDGSNGKKSANISLPTSPATDMYAALINRQTLNGAHTGDFKILEALKFSTSSSNVISGRFSPIEFKPGEYCIYYYLDNGTISNESAKEYLKNTIFSKYNSAANNNKYAFINQQESNYLKNNLIPIKHGACFNEKVEITTSIIEPNFPSIIAQANNQNLKVRLQTNAPSNVKANWSYDVKLISGSSIENSSKVINLPISPGLEEFNIQIKPEYIGSYNLVIKLSYFDNVIKKTYVGEVSKQINIVQDLNPVAKITTINPEKLILKSSEDPNDKAEFTGGYSYDPNKAVFGEQVYDGIKSYTWLTEYKPLETTGDNFTPVSSPYQSNSNVYAVGPNKTPGTYRALLNVFDFFNKTSNAKSDTVQIIRPGQNLLASLSVKNSKKILEPGPNGTSNVKLQANIKVIDAKNNKPDFIQYKFIWGDGQEEQGSIDKSKFDLGQFINLPELTDRNHLYSEGEYIPRIQVSATFKDGHSESWTVSAGTVTIAKLPTLVAFTAIIANLGPKQIANPGFNADLKVTGKEIFNTQVSSFGWIYGDGTSWTYAGSSPNTDFMKATVTNKNHIYNQVGIYEIKFWVKTTDKPDPIVFTLKPLEIKNLPLPVITSLSINSKQGANIKISDEDLITINSTIDSIATLNRVDLIVRKKGDNSVAFSETFIGGITNSFSKTLNELYLEPGLYFVDFRVVDEYEREVSKTLGFEVVKTADSIAAINFNEIAIYSTNKPVYTHQIIHKLPIEIQSRLRELNIFNKNTLFKSYTDVRTDIERYEIEADEEVETNTPKTELEIIESELDLPYLDEVHPAALTVDLIEGLNEITIEGILPNDKKIRSKPYKIFLDSTEPLLTLESPSDLSIYESTSIRVSGNIFDENIDKVFYKINNSLYKPLTIEVDEEDPYQWYFNQKIDISKHLKEDQENIIEVMALDKAQNASYRYASIYIDPKLNSQIFKPNIKLIGEKAIKDFSKLPKLSFNRYKMMNTAGRVVNGKRQGESFNIEFMVSACDETRNGTIVTRLVFNSFYPTWSFKSIAGETFINDYSGKQFYDQVATKLKEDTNKGYIFTLNQDLDDSCGDFYYLAWNEVNSIKGARFDPRSTNIQNVWTIGHYVVDTNAVLAEQDKGTDIYNLEEALPYRIVSSVDGDRIDISNLSTIPEILFASHNIDKLDLAFQVQSITPLNIPNDLSIFINLNDKLIELNSEEHKLTYTVTNQPLIDTSESPYRYSLQVTAENLPPFKNKDNNSIEIWAKDPTIDFVIARGSQKLNVKAAPSHYVKIESIVEDDNGLNEEDFEKEKNTVSNKPKNFLMTVYHIDDNGLTPKEKCSSYKTDGKSCASFDKNGSVILSNLSINKLDLFDKSRIVERNELNFTLTENSTLMEEGTYAGFWKTIYKSIGPDNGGTIYRDSGDLQFSIDMISYFSQKASEGYDLNDKDPKRFKYNLDYTIDPVKVTLEDLTIDSDELFFEPDIESAILTGNDKKRNLVFNTDEQLLNAKYNYEEELTDKVLKTEFENKIPKPNNPNKFKIEKPGIRIGNKKRGFVKLDLALPELTKISFTKDDNSESISIPLNIALKNQPDILLQKDELTTIDATKNLVLPISIILKSDSNLDIALSGTLKSSTTVIKFMDFPYFDNQIGADPNDLNNPSIKVKIERNKDTKELILEKSILVNFVGQKFDPLEMEVQLYNDFHSAIGNPFIINGSTLNRAYLSPIRSKKNSAEGGGIHIRKILEANLTKHRTGENGAEEVKLLLDDAEYVSFKLRRSYSYLTTVVPQDRDIQEFYNVEEGDPFRYRKVKIDLGLRNYCSIEFNGIKHPSPLLIVSDPNNIQAELNKVKVRFESASKKGAKIWITKGDLKVGNSNIINHSFNNTVYSSSNFDSEGDFVSVNPDENEILKTNEGIFDFDGFTPPEESNYDINFIVGKASSNLNAITLGDSDTNLAVACVVKVISNIKKANIIIDPMLNKDATYTIPTSNYPVTISTDPKESIDGVTVEVFHMEDGHLTPDPIAYTRNGPYIELNLASLANKKIGIDYTLLATLTYKDNNPPYEFKIGLEPRTFLFVNDAEPTVIFGNNNYLSDLIAEDGSGSILIAKPGQNYDFKTTANFTGLDATEINNINFKLIERANPSSIIELQSTNSLSSNNVVYDVSGQIPFFQITDIKEYSLKAFKSNKPLSTISNFLIINNPELKLNSPDKYLNIQENKGSLKFNAILENGFPSQLYAQIKAFDSEGNSIIEGDKPKVDTEEISGIEYNAVQEFEVTQDTSFSSNSVVAEKVLKKIILKPLAVAVAPELAPVIGVVEIAILAFQAKKTIDDLVNKSTAGMTAFVKKSLETKSQPKLFAINPGMVFDLELQDTNGNKVEFFSPNITSYKLKIHSSIPGKIIIRARKNYEPEDKIKEIFNSEITEESLENNLHNYPLYDGINSILSKSYTSTTTIQAPSIITGSNIGILSLEVIHIDKNNKQLVSIRPFIFINFNRAFGICLLDEIQKQGNLADYAAALIKLTFFATLARINSSHLLLSGITTIHGVYEPDAGNIIEDLVRIIPQTGYTSNKLRGYCKSLASHVIKIDTSEQDLLRVFEAKNHLPTTNEDDYRVYWLGTGNKKYGLLHILDGHGYNAILVNPTDTKFNEYDDIVNLLKTTIIDADKKGIASKRYPNDTAFQKLFEKGSWFDNINLQTKSIQVRTSTSDNYRIETVFPISSVAGSKL